MESDTSGREVEDLVADYIDRLNRGERLTADGIRAAHPELAEELLEHLEAFLDLEDDRDLSEPLGTLGDFTLRRQIGRGGMGVVYEAWENSMDRRVALKVLPPGIAADERALQRFVREAKTAGQLNHPNVVSVYGMGLKEQTPYFAMEYVEGKTLAQVLTSLRTAKPDAPTPFGKKDDVRYFVNIAECSAAVADGLQHAHSKGVIHRDIKPSNLILDRSGDSRDSSVPRLRILDFGLAHLEGQESLSASGDVVGTPLYMSPEQARRSKIPIDRRTDIYSLGATLYEILVLRPPFQGKDHADTLSQIIERDPVEPRKLNPRIPPDLETIVLKCLRKDPADRYGTTEALGQDLRRFVRGDAIEAKPIGTWEKTSRRLRRHRKLVVVSAAALALALAGLSTTTVLIAKAYRIATGERDARAHDLYIADMRLAMQDWQAGDLGRFETLLERHLPQPGQPDMRGWEWYYLRGLPKARLLTTLRVDPGGVTAASWQPGGHALATAGADGKIRVWSTADSVLLQEFTLPCPVLAVSWEPTGRRLASVTTDGSVRAWEIGCRDAVFSTRTEARNTRAFSSCVSWSPDGALLSVGTKRVEADRCRGGVVVLDASTGSQLRKLDVTEGIGVLSVGWSPDGSHLAAAIQLPGIVVVWDSRTWERAQTFRPFAGDWLNSLAWSPTGTQIAVSRMPGTGETAVWDIGTNAVRAVLHAGGACLSWSPRGEVLATGDWAGSIYVWDLSKADEVAATIRAHLSAVTSVSWSPDGNALASASEDGTVKVWDPVQKNEPHLRAPAGWSPEGRYLCAGDGGDALQVRDASTGDVLGHHGFGKRVVQFSWDPTGSRFLAVAVVGDEVLVWDWAQGDVKRLSGHGAGGLYCLASWSPDGQLLATGGWDGVLRLWARNSWELFKEIPAHASTLGAAAWSPDGSRLATTAADLELKIWDTADWRVLHTLRRARWAQATGWEATVQGALSWSHDGKRLAAAVAKGIPKGFIILDAVSGDVLFQGQAHLTGTHLVSWSPSGNRLATSGDDYVVKIWDSETCEELIAIRVPDLGAGCSAIEWHPDGRRLLLAGERVIICDASAGIDRTKQR